jgi:hypothetical protein
MSPYLFIVSRRDHALFELLKERFAGDDKVEVILDRRMQPEPGAPPGVDRRIRPEVTEEIRTRGYAVVTLS